MLELKNIKKDYPAGGETVHALKGINLKFRRNEFVSILGPSGCGKTTMLNIIGGLDQYTEGDLMINGTSTKEFTDRDWDTYRNHSIGFVFQSYNLIPHQTVLQNVELALTLSGVTKGERKDRAVKALEEVGLGNQLSKKPSEMSGGQMQRVAIARALVNNPDIILADEPTGALDSETSVQVMEILKEISKDRLIIMVTHNPELAKQYSTRIIRMLDGEIKDDSTPLTEKEIQLEEVEDKRKKDNTGKVKKPSMSFTTSLSLSMKNLISKKRRTALTAFAGSIGIIGIALILAVSQGLTGYIDTVQEETLSSYPLTIEETNTDLTSLMETFMGMESDELDHNKKAVYKRSAVYEIMNAMNNLEVTENDLKTFKKFIETEKVDEDSETGLYHALSGVQYSYNLDLMVYTKNVDGTIIRSDSEELMKEIMQNNFNIDMSAMESSSMGSMESSMGAMSSMSPMASSVHLWQEMLPGNNGETISDLLKKQYDVVYGDWPNSYDEVVLVLDENNELDDLTLYALGLESKESIDKIADAAINGSELESNNKKWSYEEICDMEFRIVVNSNCFSYDEKTGLYNDLRTTDAGLQYLYDNGTALKVAGIIRPKEDSEAAMLSGSIGYTSDLTKYVVNESKESSAIDAQLEDETTDIFTGLPFKEAVGDMSDEEKEKEFRAYIEGMDDAGKAEAYVKIMSIPTEEQVETAVSEGMKGMNREDMETTLVQVLTEQMGMSEEDVSDYVKDMTDDEISDIMSQMMAEQVKAQYAAQVQEQMAAMQPQQLIMALDAAMETYTAQQCALYHDEIMEFSESTYEDNLAELGYVDLDDPTAVNLYAASFDDKDVIEDAIADYNEGKDDLSQIKYTDYVGLMMSSVSSIINMITYVLIAFVSISLIVSSIMIGVITLISVQERTKEIGILRAIGASKQNVSSLFNAETMIIGLASGALGVLVTYLLCIPINMILHEVTGISTLNANLPVPAALILVAISIVLTMLSGLIPSKSAAKKDPVVALRSE